MAKGDEKWPFREPGARVPRGFVAYFSPSPSRPPPLHVVGLPVRWQALKAA